MISSETVHKTVITKTRNDLKRPEMTYNEQETTWNNLQYASNDMKRPTTTYMKQKTTWNDPPLVRHSLQWSEPTSKKKTQNDQQHTDFDIILQNGAIGYFSNMFSTQHIFAIIRALFHKESWWK